MILQLKLCRIMHSKHEKELNEETKQVCLLCLNSVLLSSADTNFMHNRLMNGNNWMIILWMIQVNNW